MLRIESNSSRSRSVPSIQPRESSLLTNHFVNQRFPHGHHFLDAKSLGHFRCAGSEPLSRLIVTHQTIHRGTQRVSILVGHQEAVDTVGNHLAWARRTV